MNELHYKKSLIEYYKIIHPDKVFRDNISFDELFLKVTGKVCSNYLMKKMKKSHNVN